MDEPAPPPTPQRPANLAHGRWLGDLGELSAPEEALVAACAGGEFWEPEGWDDERPTEATPANTIRADVIRFLMLGGDNEHPVHEKGVMSRGAWITGELDLRQARCTGRLAARKCYFEDKLCLAETYLQALGGVDKLVDARLGA